jgi:UDP-2,3-diacylglucosamine hydrolase
MTTPPQILGIIAGGGTLPAQLIEACHAQKNACFVVALDGFADMESIGHAPCAVVRLGAVGEALDYFKKHNVTTLVLAGRVRRPSLTSLRPDRMGAKLLARLGASFFSGDDAVLKAVIRFLEEEGFKVIGANDILAGLIAPEGVLGHIMPSTQARADIAQGITILKTLGKLDIGQAIIVENGYVLGVEAAEGTDALIARCATLRREKSSGVLIKFRKPGQEQRVDLPTIGPSTIEQLHAAGFAGIAIESGGSIILDRDATLQSANTRGLFVIGVSDA